MGLIMAGDSVSKLILSQWMTLTWPKVHEQNSNWQQNTGGNVASKREWRLCKFSEHKHYSLHDCAVVIMEIPLTHTVPLCNGSHFENHLIYLIFFVVKSWITCSRWIPQIITRCFFHSQWIWFFAFCHLTVDSQLSMLHRIHTVYSIFHNLINVWSHLIAVKTELLRLHVLNLGL